MADLLKTIEVPTWPRPRGYANGMITAGEGERILFVAGQIGWNADPNSATGGTFDTDDFVEQFGRALDNVLTVVRAAGGTHTSVARLTIYATDLDAYRTRHRAIGEAYRARFAKHYPTMALIGVAGLVEPRAKVEIEATCVIGASEHT